jgi:hypothetical protein
MSTSTLPEEERLATAEFLKTTADTLKVYELLLLSVADGRQIRKAESGG